MIFVTGGAWQGKRAFVDQTWPQAEVVDQLHRRVREMLDAGEDPQARVMDVIRRNPDVIFISDMIGSGIIPMNPEEDAWRECHGRLCCRLAARAREVYLVTCGIGQRIK